MYSMYLYRYKENEKRFLNSSHRFKKKVKDNGGVRMCVFVCVSAGVERELTLITVERKERKEGGEGGRMDGRGRERGRK